MALVKFKGGQKLLAVLKEMEARANSAKDVSVGFMDGATYPDGTSVAMVAAIQNFGAPAAHIPARPFFSGMVAKRSPTWGTELGKILKLTKFDADSSLQLMGNRIGNQLQASIRETDSPPLAPSTIKQKGFSKPLIDTSHMLNSVEYEVKNSRHKVTEGGS